MDDLFQALVAENIEFSDVLLELKAEGLKAFEEAFAEIMESLKG